MGNKGRVYGIPYQGSKNQIAEWVVQQLPGADTFVDLFAGGCAVTHCAIRSGKYRNFIANDVCDAPQLFIDAVNGKYRDEKRWISREEFFRLKDADPYVRYCWSFGNKGGSYLYSENILLWKKAYHYAVMFEDLSLFREIGVGVADVGIPSSQPKERRIEFRQQIRKNNKAMRKQYTKFLGFELKANGDLWHLPHLERLDRIKKLEETATAENLSFQKCDYQSVNIPGGDCVIYCDPPYKRTEKYNKTDFDHDRFYNWVRQNTEKMIIISEYNMPDDFVIIAEKSKYRLMNGNTNSSKAKERLYVHRDTLNQYKMRCGKILTGFE